MAKVTLNVISNLLSGSSLTKLNENFTTIATAFENTLSRDGTAPNALQSNLDVNNKRLINVPYPANPLDIVRKVDVTDIATEAANTVVAVERAERIAADTTLTSRIAAEESTRYSTDMALASLIGQAGSIEVPYFDSQLAASLAVIGANRKSIRTGGFTASGDAGGALYKRVSTEPTHQAKFRSADRFLPDGSTSSSNGGWWEIADVITPEALGAVGDGVTDCGNTWARAMAAAAVLGRPLVGRPGAVYNIKTLFTTILGGGQVLDIDLRGACLRMEGAGMVLRGNSVAVYSETLGANLARGDKKITMSSVASVQVGDVIEILSPALIWGPDESAAHYYEVADIDGNDVFLTTAVVADVTTQQVTDTGQTGPIILNVRRYGASVSLRNGRIDCVLVGTTAGGTSWNYLDRLQVSNMVMTGGSRAQISTSFSKIVDVSGCSFSGFGFVTKYNNYGNEETAPGGNSFGYGINISRAIFAKVSRCVGGRGWHMSDFQRGTMLGVVEDCIFKRNSYGCSCHEGCWRMVVKGCVFEYGSGALGFRCIYFEVRDCIFNGPVNHCVFGGQSNLELIATGNTVNGAEPGEGINSGGNFVEMGTDITIRAGSMSAGYGRRIVVSDNVFHGSGFGINLTNKVGEDDSIMIFDNNKFPTTGGAGASLAFNIRAGRLFITNNIVCDRTWHTFRVYVDGGASQKIIIKGNVKTGTEPTAGSALVSVEGSGTISFVDVVDNKTTGALLRSPSNTIRDVIGNRADTLVTGTVANITNLVSNVYRSRGSITTVAVESGSVVVS